MSLAFAGALSETRFLFNKNIPVLKGNGNKIMTEQAMNLSDKQMTEIAQHAFTRMDGAWFLGLARKFGIQTAWEMDVEAWKQFSYVFGKNIRKTYIPNPVWPQSFLDLVDILSRVVKMEGRKISLAGDQVVIRITDCETQKAIAKAGVADCGIVTIQTYEGMINGLFNGEVPVDVAHTKNLNHGDEYCEIVVTRKPAK